MFAIEQVKAHLPKLNIFMSNISIDFEPVPHYGVYKAHLNMPYTRDQIIDELVKVKWGTTHEAEIYEEHYWDGARHKLYDIPRESPILFQLHLYFTSDQFKRRVINYCYEQMPRVFQENWSNWTPEKMFENTHTHCEFIKDGPGLEIPLHTDSRIVIGGGMIYFAEQNDPRISTNFYSDRERNHPWTAETNFCDGWWHANSNNTYHDGGNKADYDRYAMLYCLSVTTKTW